VKGCCFRTAWDSGMVDIMAVVYSPDGSCSFYTAKKEHGKQQKNSNGKGHVHGLEYHELFKGDAPESRAEKNIPASATRCLRTEPNTTLDYPRQLKAGTDEATCCSMIAEVDVHRPSKLSKANRGLMSTPALATGVKLARKTLCGTRKIHANPFDNTCAIRHVPAKNRDKISRGEVFSFTSHQGTTANVCLIEKAGSTEWLNLFEADAYMEKFRANHHDKGAATAGTIAGTVYAAKSNPPPPSIVFVRNPYTRFLSAYLDKVVGIRGSSRVSFNGDFGAFVKLVCKETLKRLLHPGSDGDKSGPAADEHFGAESGKCGLNMGFVYDLVLRVEEQPMWYETLVTMLGLKETVQMFDGTVPKDGMSLSHNKSLCFYKPPGLECADLFTTAEPKVYQGESTAGDSSKAGEDQVGHATDAADQLAEYYTPKIAHAVTALYIHDFYRFDYPTWDGKNGKTFDALLGETVGPMSIDEQAEQLKRAIAAL